MTAVNFLLNELNIPQLIDRDKLVIVGDIVERAKRMEEDQMGIKEEQQPTVSNKSLVDLLRDLKKTRKNYHEILIIEKWIAEAHLVHYIQNKDK